jgi:hypothetical protein
MSTASEPQPSRPRDPRLDVFRGLGMMIILVAHIPWNSWTDWIPARFGFSDAAEMFVFCSGMASAIAFGRIFSERGWSVGTLRILYRVWQVYWAHIAVFMVIAAMMAAADNTFGGSHYVRMELNLGPFFDDPLRNLVGLMTLTYVPNYFDILPMYLVVLALVPVAMGLAAFGRLPVLVFVLGLWSAATFGNLNLPAEPFSDRPWFFDPFAWQLVFFLGFAFARGWLKPPPNDRRLVLAALAILVLASPVSCQYGFGCYAGFGHLPVLGAIHDSLGPLIGKSHLGVLRIVHFVALAYLAYLAAGEGGRHLKGKAADILRRVGQQTLAVFLAGLVLAQALGIVLDRLGHGEVLIALANVIGFGLLIAVALVVGWFKSSPWTRPRAKPVGRGGEAAAEWRAELSSRGIVPGYRI